jgi:hypothetical protein
VNNDKTSSMGIWDDGALPSLRYAWYVAFVLMFCYTFSFIDRQIMAFLVGSIKHACAACRWVHSCPAFSATMSSTTRG